MINKVDHQKGKLQDAIFWAEFAYKEKIFAIMRETNERICLCNFASLADMNWERILYTHLLAFVAEDFVRNVSFADRLKALNRGLGAAIKKTSYDTIKGAKKETCNVFETYNAYKKFYPTIHKFLQHIKKQEIGIDQKKKILCELLPRLGKNKKWFAKYVDFIFGDKPSYGAMLIFSFLLNSSRPQVERRIATAKRIFATLKKENPQLGLLRGVRPQNPLS